MMVIKQGRFGKFLACPGYPDCKNAKPITEELDVPCPKCGEKAQYSYARVVGFWTKMENWSEARREEGAMRQWENINER